MFDLAKVSKAIAGGLAAILIVGLSKLGVALAPEFDGALNTVLDTIIAAVIGYVAVYFAPKNKA